MLSGLDALSLCNVHRDPPTIDDILSLLQSSPALSTLGLRDSNFLASPTQSYNTPFVNLHRLESLHLTDLHCQAVSTFLQRIQAPSCALVALRCSLDRVMDASSLISLIRPFAPQAVEVKDSRLILEIGPDGIHCSVPALPYDLRLRILGARTSSFLEPFLFIFPRNMRDMDTRITLLHNITSIETEATLAIANALHVTHLAVCTDGANASNAALRSLTQPPNAHPHNRWLFPALQELCITSDQATPKLLIKTVQARYGADDNLPLPFTSLSIYGSDCRKSHRATIEGIVGKGVLEWGTDIDPLDK